MGKPKFSRKKYETPSHPWQEDRIKVENELIRKYGLKNKREVWRAQTRLRKFRGQAREISAKISTGDAQSKKESDQLLMHLNRMNILPPNSTLDDVLALETESILSRRLQTLTYLKGLANTPNQARQLISHGHIAIGNRKVTVPSYMVTKDEEGEIGYTMRSALNDLMHPVRPRSDFKSVSIKRETKGQEPKVELKEKKAVKTLATQEPPKKEKEEVKAEKPPGEESETKEPSKEEALKVEVSEKISLESVEPSNVEESKLKTIEAEKPKEKPKEDTESKEQKNVKEGDN